MSQAEAVSQDDHFKGVLLVGASAVLWSLGGLIVRSLDTADPWTTIFWRSLFAAAFLLLVLLVRDGRKAFRLFRVMGVPGLLVALCFTAASVGFVTALVLHLGRPNAGDHERGAADRRGSWPRGSR